MIAAEPVGVIYVATGLAREAAMIARSGVRVFACGGHGGVLAERLEQAITAERPAGLMSVGIAGGLDPSLAVGSLVVGTGVGALAAEAAWAAWLSARLPEARMAPLAGVDVAVVSAAGKASLRQATGAAVVDMESHVVARIAAAHGLPFAVLRAVSDGAGDDLPRAAQVPLTEVGGVRFGRVLAEVVLRPWQVPALLRLARNTDAAVHALSQGLERLGGRLK